MATQLNYELYKASQHYEKKTSFNWFEKCANVPPKVVIHVHHVDEEGFGGDVLPVFYLFIFFSKKKISSLSKSFIFLCIMIVFLVIFWPGRCILRTIQIEEFNVKVSKPI